MKIGQAQDASNKGFCASRSFTRHDDVAGLSYQGDCTCQGQPGTARDSKLACMYFHPLLLSHPLNTPATQPLGTANYPLTCQAIQKAQSSRCSTQLMSTDSKDPIAQRAVPSGLMPPYVMAFTQDAGHQRRAATSSQSKGRLVGEAVGPQSCLEMRPFLQPAIDF